MSFTIIISQLSSLQKTCWRAIFIRVQQTVRANKKDFLKELPATNCDVKRLRQGEALFRRKNNVVSTVWKDKRIVHFISTQSNPVGDDIVNRKQRNGTIIQVPTVPVVKSYY